MKKTNNRLILTYYDGLTRAFVKSIYQLFTKRSVLICKVFRADNMHFYEEP